MRPVLFHVRSCFLKASRCAGFSALVRVALFQEVLIIRVNLLRKFVKTHSEMFESDGDVLNSAVLRLLESHPDMSGDGRYGKRDLNKLHTLRNIYLCALELFDRQGFDKTTVEEIATSVGITQRTLFNYFPTKEAIVSFPIGYLGRSLSSLVRTADPESTPLEALGIGILKLFEEVQKTPSLRNALQMGYKVVNRTPSLSELNLSRRSQLYLVAWKALLERGVDPDDDVLRAAASGIVACSLASLFSWLDADMSFRLDLLAKSALSIMTQDLIS